MTLESALYESAGEGVSGQFDWATRVENRPEVELKQTLVNVIDYITACGIQRRPALDSMVKHRTSDQFSMLELASLSSPGTMGLDGRLPRLHPKPPYHDYRIERIGVLL